MANNSYHQLFPAIIAISLVAGCDNRNSTPTSDEEPIALAVAKDAPAVNTEPTRPNQKKDGSEHDVVALVESMDGVVKRNENGDVISVALIGSRSNQFSDQDLPRLAVFRHITLLNLTGCEKLTDNALRHLDRLPGLKTLFMNPQISNMGLEHLGELRTLEKLYLFDCDVSDEAISTLQLALPNCEIKR